MEYWDLYNKDRALIGEHIRGQEMPENGYHIVVHVWIKNSAGEYLLSQRALSRPTCPLKWECVGGSVVKGEDSLTGALREVREEAGIELDPAAGRFVYSLRRDTVDGARCNDFSDVWLFPYDGEPDLSRATTDEVAQLRWMRREEIEEFFAQGIMVDRIKDLSYFLTDKENFQ